MKNYCLMLLFFSTISSANDAEYHKVRDEVFWPEFYTSNYETLYCKVEKRAGEKVSLEHVYPADWIASSLGCEDRDNCDLEIYKRASSDLHNLWPALQRYNSSRSNLIYAEIDGETQRFPEDNCDFERHANSVEPRDEVKGIIARSYLYMILTYGLPKKGISPLMIKWSAEHPVTEIEIIRNKRIIELQGRPNPFISNKIVLSLQL
ncbi:endonuclease [Thalassotalea psychrophila]|uniref:Endonuclease n=1 Tax=Thalassotalea psychrophila TaxID=3065647 RepID=A0ABY9TUG3_9GAMM|nr:endonuclease [Colwelliaceae bacterium SQ149]